MSRTLQRLVARTLSLLLLAALSATAQAVETWYMVELIVFAQRNPDSGSEHWPTDQAVALVELNAAANIPGAGSGPGKDARLQTLPPEQYRLHAEAKRLGEDGNYTVLRHIGWRQPGLARDEALAVRLQGASSATATGSLPGAQLLDGTVRLVLSRYLHLEADLLYRPETAAAAESHSFFASAERAEAPVYRLQESRRMRSKEVHYLDHPMFGVIALVTPYEVAPARAPVPTSRHQ